MVGRILTDGQNPDRPGVRGLRLGSEHTER